VIPPSPVLQIDWPTSGTIQVFRDLAANQSIEVDEFDSTKKTLPHKPIPLPE
jgi:hypothetical protein